MAEFDIRNFEWLVMGDPTLSKPCVLSDYSLEFMILGYSDSLSYALSPLMFVALDA
jgi:hypothetical protein